MLRTFPRLLEMALPVAAVFWTHMFFLLFDAAFFLATGNAAGCSVARQAPAFVMFVLGFVGSFSWGSWQTVHRSLRDGFVASLVYACYCYAMFTDVWVCANANNATAFQIVLSCVLGFCFLVAVIALVMTCIIAPKTSRAVAVEADDKELKRMQFE